MDIQHDKLLSPDVVAAFLDINTSSLKVMRKKGTGPKYFRITHNIVRYKESDVLSWLKQNHELMPGIKVPTHNQDTTIADLYPEPRVAWYMRMNRTTLLNKAYKLVGKQTKHKIDIKIVDEEDQPLTISFTKHNDDEYKPSHNASRVG